MKDKVQKKKILVVTSYYYPHTGGVAVHTYNLYQKIVANHPYEVALVASDLPHGVDEIPGQEISIHRLSPWFTVSNTPINPLWYWRIKKLIKECKPDVICVHTPVPFLADCAVLAAGDVPVVFKYHHVGSMAKGSPLIDWVLVLYEKTILPILLNTSKSILTSSEFTRRTFFDAYLEKTRTITPGVAIQRFITEKRCSDNRLLFIAGNLDPTERYKGLTYLLDAMPNILHTIPDTILTVVGDGRDKAYYQEMARSLGIEKQVRFTGKLLGADLVNEFHHSSVFVLPSVVDSTPNVILEAMASKLPVVGSDTGGIPDLIDDGKTGLLVPPKDVSALSKAIITLLLDKDTADRMGAAGFENVSTHYTWDKKAGETVEVIKESLEQVN